MRPDEGGCADLRRSLTARTKPVRSLIYASPRRRCPRAGATVVRGCARGVSVALPPEGRYLSKRSRRPRRYRAPCGRRQPTRLRRPDTVRSPCARPVRPRLLRQCPPRAPTASRTLAGTASSPLIARTTSWNCSQRATSAHWLISSNRLRPRPLPPPVPVRADDHRTGPGCRDVKSRPVHGEPTSRAPQTLDARASAELSGIRGECERTSRGLWNRAQRQLSADWGAFDDTYARAAAPDSYG